MNPRILILSLALSLGSLAACGDDGDDTQTTDASATVADASLPTGDGAVASGDGGLPATNGDAAVGAGDGGAGDLDAAVPDAGPIVAGDASSVAQDSAVPKPDSGGEDAGGSTLAQSDACLACEMTSCVDRVPGAPRALGEQCDALEGVAMAGTKVGTPRSELCTAVVDCARRTGCAQPDITTCLCGDLPFSECQSIDSVFDLGGACRDEIIAASESLESGPIIEGYVDFANTAHGAALDLLACSEAKCADECYAPCAGTSDTEVCDVDLSDGTPLRTCMMNSCPDDYYYVDIWDEI